MPRVFAQSWKRPDPVLDEQVVAHLVEVGADALVGLVAVAEVGVEQRRELGHERVAGAALELRGDVAAPQLRGRAPRVGHVRVDEEVGAVLRAAGP